MHRSNLHNSSYLDNRKKQPKYVQVNRENEKEEGKQTREESGRDYVTHPWNCGFCSHDLPREAKWLRAILENLVRVKNIFHIARPLTTVSFILLAVLAAVNPGFFVSRVTTSCIDANKVKFESKTDCSAISLDSLLMFNAKILAIT